LYLTFLGKGKGRGKTPFLQEEVREPLKGKKERNNYSEREKEPFNILFSLKEKEIVPQERKKRGENIISLFERKGKRGKCYLKRGTRCFS